MDEESICYYIFPDIRPLCDGLKVLDDHCKEYCVRVYGDHVIPFCYYPSDPQYVFCGCYIC